MRVLITKLIAEAETKFYYMKFGFLYYEKEDLWIMFYRHSPSQLDMEDFMDLKECFYREITNTYENELFAIMKWTDELPYFAIMA